jgi:uncharacterized protein YcfJ
MKRILILAMVMAFALAGCSSTPDGQRTQAEGTAIGALGGAALGAIIGAFAGGGDGAAAGAAIGAAVGGGAGYLYGTHVAQQKQKYATTEDWLNACIASAQKANDETRAYNLALANEISQLDLETQNLAAAYQQKQVQKATLGNEKRKIDFKLAEANKKLEQAKLEEQNQQKALADAGKEVHGPQTAQLDAQIRELKGYINELEDKTRKLASLSARMAV